MQRQRLCLAVGVLIGAFLFVSCDSRTSAPSAKKAETASAAPAPGAALSFPVKGKALEVLAGGGFTYILIESGDKQWWVAVPGTEVAVGETVGVARGQLMRNFPSKALGRTFEELLVAPALEDKPVRQAAAPHGMGDKNASRAEATGSSFAAALQAESAAAMDRQIDPEEVTMGSSKAVVPFAELKVEKAKGANSFTVGELFARASSLDGRQVLVRGQVMKVSPNIMGRNWLHIQDGTGDPLQNSHDLVVTSDETAEKGEIVTVNGTLSADKNFGAGYVYAVIVEEASVSR